MEIVDDDDDDVDGDDNVDGFLVDEDDDVDDDEDDDEVIIPLRNMKKWLENKPSGFGVGKEYDTSVEDKLMEEIEQSKKAQLANINKLKNNNNNPIKANSKVKNVQLDKDVQDGLCVRLVNLPKKMNVDKDLRAAFKGVPGIVNIVPVVSGNKKTRNPICKGLAYINFKSKDEAQRFVKMYSGQSISFGKVQKQIKCEMMNPGSPKSTSTQSVDKIKYVPEQEEPDLQGDMDDEFDTDSEENISSDHDVAEMEDISINDYLENGEISSESTSGDEQGVREEANFSEQEKKAEAKEKKKKPKQKKEKVSKLNIPESARKLKIKENNSLTGVLSKYAQKNTVLTDLQGDMGDEFDTDLLSSDSEENISTDYEVAEMEDLSTNDYVENGEISSVESTSGEEQDVAEESHSSEQEKKVEAKEKKKKPKQKKEKLSKLNIPGSARKLKMKEKNLLSGVLSKYAQKSTVSTVKEQS